MGYGIKEIAKIVVYDKETGKVLMECEPTTQPLTMTITNENEEK